jgi:hypothetical protein
MFSPTPIIRRTVKRLRSGCAARADEMFHFPLMRSPENGLIDSITLENSIRAVRNVMSQPVERALWLRNRLTYADELASFVDEMIAEAPPAKPVDLAAQLKADLARAAG